MENKKRITFTLDDVFRNKTIKIGKVYQQNIDKSIKLDEIDFSSGDYKKIFGFKTKKEFEQFLYEDYVFQIFGAGEPNEPNIYTKMNLWHIDLSNKECYDNIKLQLANMKEKDASIGCTCFFISKMATKVRDIFFPINCEEIWDRSDVIVTTDIDVLENKPEGKIAVKIKNDYNENCPCDYCYNTLTELFEDSGFIEKIMEK